MFIIVHGIIVSEIFPVNIIKGWIYDFLGGLIHSSGPIFDKKGLPAIPGGFNWLF